MKCSSLARGTLHKETFLRGLFFFRLRLFITWMPPACQTQSDYGAFKSWGFTLQTFCWTHFVWFISDHKFDDDSFLLCFILVVWKLLFLHFYTHYGTLVSRGMPLNKHINLRGAITVSHIDKHPPGQKCQEFVDWTEPNGEQQAWMYIITLRAPLPDWALQLVQWSLSVADVN